MEAGAAETSAPPAGRPAWRARDSGDDPFGHPGASTVCVPDRSSVDPSACVDDPVELPFTEAVRVSLHATLTIATTRSPLRRSDTGTGENARREALRRLAAGRSLRAGDVRSKRFVFTDQFSLFETGAGAVLGTGSGPPSPAVEGRLERVVTRPDPNVATQPPSGSNTWARWLP